MRIVYKCENPDCTYPDEVIDNPMDDNVICLCGSTAMGHHKNIEDKSTREKWEEK